MAPGKGGSESKFSHPSGGSHEEDGVESKGWVAFKEEGTRKRERELSSFEARLLELHNNKQDGLMKVVGPVIGMMDGEYVISRDGDLLGRAGKPASASDKDARVLEIPRELQSKIGNPEFPQVQYGLTNPGGDVFAAFLEGGSGLKTSPSSGLQAGKTKIIGSLALKLPSKEQSCRVLVMGGKEKQRHDFLRWFTGLSDFDYSHETKEINSEIEKIRKEMQELRERDGDEKKDNSQTKLRLEKGAEELAQLEKRKAELVCKFRMIATWADEKREKQFADLKRDLSEVLARLETLGLSKDVGGDGYSTIGSEKPSSIGDDDEFDIEEEKQELEEEKEKLQKAVSRFRHIQGFFTPLNKILEGSRQEGWNKVEKKQALGLLYHGVKGKSPLSRYGTEADFTKKFTNEVKPLMEGVDVSSYVRGEVLLCVSEKGVEASHRPPDSLILINAPDIIRDTKGSLSSSDLVDGLRDRLLPCMQSLLVHLRQADKDHSGTIDRAEFVKALEQLGLDPPIPQSEILQLFNVVDTDGGGTIEYDDLALVFEDEGGAKLRPFDQTPAFDIMGDLADVIIVLLDAKSSRFNTTELQIVKSIYKKHSAKMHMACANNSNQSDAMGRTLQDLLGDRSLRELRVISPEIPDIVSFVTTAINVQQQQAASMLNGFRKNIDNILLRLTRMFSPSLAAENGGAILDPSAVAACADLLIKACERAARQVPKSGGKLLQELKAAMRKAQTSARDVLARAHVKILTLQEREDKREDQRKKQESAERAVKEQAVTDWMSWQHVEAWLKRINVEDFTISIFKKEEIFDLHTLLRVDETKMKRWKIPVGDKVRIKSGLKRVKKIVSERKCSYLSEGLWWLLTTEPPNPEKVKVRMTPEALYDQGPDKPVKFRGHREGDLASVDAPSHGKIVVRVPERAELDARNWELELERMKGKAAYIESEDLGVMYGVLKGDVACSSSTKQMLEDGLHFFLTGDVPPQLLTEVVDDVRLEVEDTLGYDWAAAAAGSPDDMKKLVKPEQSKQPLPEDSRVYARRWKLEELEVEAELSSSEDEDDGATASDTPWHERLPFLLEGVFSEASGGSVVAEGHKLEEFMLKNRKVRQALQEAGANIGFGSVRVLAESDVLKREFVKGVMDIVDPTSRSDHGSSTDYASGSD